MKAVHLSHHQGRKNNSPARSLPGSRQMLFAAFLLAAVSTLTTVARAAQNQQRLLSLDEGNLEGFNDPTADLYVVIPLTLSNSTMATTAPATEHYVGGNIAWSAKNSVFNSLTIYFGADSSSTAANRTIALSNINLNIESVTGNLNFVNFNETRADDDSNALLTFSALSISVKGSRGGGDGSSSSILFALGGGGGGSADASDGSGVVSNHISDGAFSVSQSSYGSIQVITAGSGGADDNDGGSTSSSQPVYSKTAFSFTGNTLSGASGLFMVGAFTDSTTIEINDSNGGGGEPIPSFILSGTIESSAQLHIRNTSLPLGAQIGINFSDCRFEDDTGACLLWIEGCALQSPAGGGGGGASLTVGTDDGISSDGAIIIVDGNFASSPAAAAIVTMGLTAGGFVSLLSNQLLRPMLTLYNFIGNIEMWGNDFGGGGSGEEDYATTAAMVEIRNNEADTGAIPTAVLLGVNRGAALFTFRYAEAFSSIVMARVAIGCTRSVVGSGSGGGAYSTAHTTLVPDLSMCDGVLAALGGSSSSTTTASADTDALSHLGIPRCTVTSPAAIPQFLPRVDRSDRLHVESCFAAAMGPDVVTTAATSTTNATEEEANTTTTSVDTSTTVIANSTTAEDNNTNTNETSATVGNTTPLATNETTTTDNATTTTDNATTTTDNATTTENANATADENATTIIANVTNATATTEADNSTATTEENPTNHTTVWDSNATTTAVNTTTTDAENATTADHSNNNTVSNATTMDNVTTTIDITNETEANMTNSTENATIIPPLTTFTTDPIIVENSTTAEEVDPTSNNVTTTAHNNNNTSSSNNTLVPPPLSTTISTTTTATSLPSNTSTVPPLVSSTTEAPPIITTSQKADENDGGDDDNANIGIIVAIVVVVCLFIVIVAVAIYWSYCRKPRPKADEQYGEIGSATEVGAAAVARQGEGGEGSNRPSPTLTNRNNGNGRGSNSRNAYAANQDDFERNNQHFNAGGNGNTLSYGMPRPGAYNFDENGGQLNRNTREMHAI